jgi:hypothetical protein
MMLRAPLPDPIEKECSSKLRRPIVGALHVRVGETERGDEEMW